MFDKDAFAIRERALEDEFFHRVDEKLREELRRSIERDESREALAKATGLSDPALIDALIDAGFHSTTLAALTLVPAIFVAWADHKVDQLEKEAVLTAARDHGIEENGMAWQLLQSWLSKRPAKSLWTTWQQYAEAVGKTLPEGSTGSLSAEIMNLCTKVAEASGGVLGIGKISSEEREMLENIKQSLAD